MNSEDIYQILKDRIGEDVHSVWVERYIKLIESFKNQSVGVEQYTERHHILPKAKDAFPEYADSDWNMVDVTPRQHFILHWLLYRFFGGSQIYAFIAMNNKGLGSNSKGHRYKARISSRVYEKIKEKTRKKSSHDRKGKATYIDERGETHYVRTDHPKVISGEYKSTSLGRSSGVRSEEWRRAHSAILKESRKNENKTVALYFLESKIEILYHSGDLPLYLDQGWSLKSTPEYRSFIAVRNNTKMSKESRKKAGAAISRALKGRTRKVTKETVIAAGLSRRTGDADDKKYKILCFDENYRIFEVDRLTEFDPSQHKKLFGRFGGEGIRCFEVETQKKRFINPEYDLDYLPDWLSMFSEKELNREHRVFCHITKTVIKVKRRDITENMELLKAPKGNRVKIHVDGVGMYVERTFIERCGYPLNCDQCAS